VPVRDTRSARFAPPATGNGIVSRERLFDRLGQAPTTVVVGTAGYGKSSLVSSWLARPGPPGAICWLTLAASDADASRFCADLLVALREGMQGVAPGLLELASPPLFADPLQFIDAVHEALHASDAAVTLVLDDVQHLSTSEKALGVLDHFVQWAPSSTRVIIVGRTVPRIRLQRLRLDDRLELIGHSDLAFTPNETAAAVCALGLALSPEDVGSLHHVTQGWPAAVRLAALALRAAGTDDLLVGLRRDDALADYLTTEVLSAVDDDARAFLLSATVDELVCPSLVDAVRGSSGSAGMLERCAIDGLFLTREEGSGSEPWFRWHSLFAAQMRDHRRLEDPERSRELELRAARWWRDIDAATAVAHALEAGNSEMATDIIASAWLALVLDGHADTVLSLVRSLPSEVTLSAELDLALAFIAAQAGRAENAGVQLAVARRATEHLNEQALARFEVRATLIELFLVNDRADLIDAVESATQLLGHIGDGPWTPDAATVALVELYTGMGHARLQDDLPQALRLLRDAAESARASGFTALELAALAETCVPSISEGDLESTRLLAERLLADARSLGWPELLSLAPAHGYLGWLALWQGEPRRSRELLERCLSLLLPTDWGMRGLTLTTLAQACLLAGQLADAEAAARQAHDLAASGRMPPWWPSLLNALDATIAMSKGDLAAAVERAQGPDPGPGYNLADCLRARILVRGGRPQACLDVLARIPVERRFPHVKVLTEVLSAQAFQALGRQSEAQVALESALAAARPSQLMTPFLIAGPGIAGLLQERLRAGTGHPEFIPHVLHRMATGSEATVNQWGETLTEREHAVLRYLATNLSNAEIAQTEFISVNTTKTHIAHIYRKLGVANRRAALRRAAELGLI